MMRTIFTMMIVSLGLGGCKGGIPTSPPPESSDEQRKPGLFTGKKGYFEIMPRPAHEVEPTHGDGTQRKSPEQTPKRSTLEEIAAS